MAQDAEVQPAPRQNEVSSSIGRFRVWVREKPWHLWVTVGIGLLGIYFTIRLYRNRNAGGTNGGFFAGLGGPATNPPPAPSPVATPSGPTAPTHWWDSWLHSKGNPGDTVLTDPANAQGEGYYTVGSNPGVGTTLNALAARFGLRGGWRDLFYNPHNAGLPSDPNAQLASGTEVWITRSTMQS